jgi:hypothetical protein
MARPALQKLLLSDILKSRLVYIRPEEATVLLFEDGTTLNFRWWSCTSDSGTTFTDLYLSCVRGGQEYDVVDDVGYRLSREDMVRSWGSGGERGVWQLAFSAQEVQERLQGK